MGLRCPWLDEIPEIAVKVSEHGHGSVGLLLGLADERDTFSLVVRIVAIEVVSVEKQEDASARLVAHVCGLFSGGRASQEKARLG